MKKVIQNLSVSMAASLMLIQLGCAKLNTIEQSCEGTSCTEQSINAPINDELSDGSVRPLEPTENSPVLPYNKIDINNVVPSRAKYLALTYFYKNLSKLENINYVTVIDMTQHSSKKRLYLINMKTGEVVQHQVAHGRNSDVDNDGFATEFSNTVNSKQTSLGIYLTGHTYNGSNGRSLVIKGQDETNSNAEERSVVVHGSNYIDEDTGYTGRSWGCPALDKRLVQAYIDKIMGGSVLYIWHNQ